jgi:hypothetical protein
MPEIREAIEAAFEEIEGEEKGAETAKVDLPEPKVEPELEETPEKVEKEAVKPAPTLPKPEKTVAAPTAEQVRGPSSWKPAMREKFGALPAEIQAEIQRREAEISNGMREASESRRFHREAMEVISPYMAAIQSEGGTPITAIKSLLGTAYLLRNGQPHQKATMLADIIVQYGIPVEILDQALTAKIEGRQMPNDPMMSALQRELAPVRQFMQQIQHHSQATSSQAERVVAQTVDQFAQNPKNEFWEDVKETVADFLEVAATRGQQMTLQQAYDKAIMLHPEISEVVSQRKLATTANKRHTIANKAKAAGASIGTDSSPSPAQPVGKSKDIRGAVEAAFDKHMNDD